MLAKYKHFVGKAKFVALVITKAVKPVMLLIFVVSYLYKISA